MPLPLLLLVPAAAAGLVGIGKAVKAAIDAKEAKKVSEDANAILNSAKKSLDYYRRTCKKSLETLGKIKLEILNGVVSEFIDVFGQLKTVELQSSVGMNELNRYRLGSQEIKELESMSGYATSILRGLTGASAGGALTAYGAYSAAALVGVASTGTPLASLSGVVASNATLAYLGGGSIAAGGAGIVGGTLVLGGLMAGPALAIVGFIVGAKAAEEKNKAYANLASAQRYANEMKLASEKCSAISERAKMFTQLLKKLHVYARPLLDEMKSTISEKGTDYRRYSEDQKASVAQCVAIIKSIKTVVDTPILTANGNLTVESRKVLENINPVEI